MENLKIVFCDDDPFFRENLKSETVRLFQGHGIEVDAAEAASAEELLAVMGSMNCQIAFLDIELPDMDGVRLGERLRLHGFEADIIYVTNMDDRVYDVFSIRPWCFIRKSRFAEELPDAVARYVKTQMERKKQLVLQSADGELRAFGERDIAYVEAAGKTQKLIPAQAGEPFIVRCSLQELEKQLIPFGFIRIHKGFAVNYRYIRKITSRAVVLDSGESLPIGRDRLKSARESYLSFMKWRGVPQITE